jgi:CRP-like cAMP-binding protein
VIGAVLGFVVGTDPTLVALHAVSPERLGAVFPGLTRQEIMEIMTRMVRECYKPGDVVIRQGDVAERFYVLLEGEAVVTARGDSGEERELSRMEPGDFFGEIGLLARLPRTANVTAVTACTALAMDHETFADLVSGSEATEELIRRVMWERLAIVP